MSFFLILFLTSLFGIMLLIGRKIFALRGGSYDIPKNFEFVIDVPDFDHVLKLIRQKSRRYGYVTLIILIRIYVVSVHAIKKYSRKLWFWIKQKVLGFKTQGKVVKASREANKFLLKVGEYKDRIRKIKDKIKEEEGLN